MKPATSIGEFKRTVWAYYGKHKRKFPWRPPVLKLRRDKAAPYKILVSEVMSQQTQIGRVVPKYNEWIKKFPTVRALAEASVKEVLKEWQGLGYNRRGLNLKRAAEEIVSDHGGRVPKEYSELISLPGVGPYTAGAILAFAFNKPAVFIETNIRTIFIHHFFNDKNNVHDRDILPLIEKALDRKNPREWYYALMDYGAMLKATIGSLNAKSRHYVRQSPLRGSNRELRSAILKALLESAKTKDGVASAVIGTGIPASPEALEKNLRDLAREGFISKKHNKFHIHG